MRRFWIIVTVVECTVMTAQLGIQRVGNDVRDEWRNLSAPAWDPADQAGRCAAAGARVAAPDRIASATPHVPRCGRD